MDRMRYIVVTLFILQWQGCHSAQLTSPFKNDQALYVCDHSNVTLPWHVTLNPGDVISDTQWLYKGQSEQLVAMKMRGNFVPLASYAHRVEEVDNAGIRLDAVGEADSGNYTLLVDGFDEHGAHFELRQSVILHVNTGLMTQDGSLHVSQASDAVLDTATGRWTLELQCGHFLDRPPFDVAWTTPGGQLLASSGYRDGQFTLLVPQPVEDGVYGCHIPAAQLSAACLQTHVEAGLEVHKLDATLTVMSRENRELRTALEQLRQDQRLLQEQLRTSAVTADIRLTRLETNVTELQQQLGLCCQGQATTAANLTHLAGVAQDALQRVADLQERVGRDVSFHAVHAVAFSAHVIAPLVVRMVEYNRGNAYDPATGVFTAPLPGTYFFLGRVGASGTAGTSASVSLVVDNSLLDQVTSTSAIANHPDTAAVQGVVHLNAHQRVFLRSNGGAIDPSIVAFSGFLVSPDA